MTKLHGVIGNRPELVFISDQCTAIKRAVFTLLLMEFIFTISKAILSLNSRCVKLFGINSSQPLLMQQRYINTKNLKSNLKGCGYSTRAQLIT